MKTLDQGLFVGKWRATRTGPCHLARKAKLISTFMVFMAFAGVARGQFLSPDANNYARLAQKLKDERALLKIGPQVIFPPSGEKSETGKYPWKRNSLAPFILSGGIVEKEMSGGDVAGK